ncbi:hypothetical protein PNE09_08175 [[Eubacterium] siraeum]|uniref:Uncharacterized protein n=1 Tax=[Eubacterium] siraeum TaxID=39492 RepID=A0AAW6D5N6_9FIRM|nr:hypothetical protein [[Eubacterium] siraeum]MDB8004045.1 hypothetical protein [[Eubacterium] siraeum]
MKKSLQALIITGLLLTVFGTMCGCQSTAQTSQSSSDIIRSSEVEATSNSGKSETKLDIHEEKMPALDIKQNGGGDEQSAFYGAQEISKLGLFSQKFENLVKESCTEKEFQEYMTWSEENDNPVDNKDRPYNINEMPNLPNVVKKYSLNHDKVYEILKDLQKYYTELSSESENAKYADMIYTDEEIEAIASGDVKKCFNLFTYNTSIMKNDLIYTPAYIYNNTMDKLEEAGITAEEIAARTEIYGSFSLTDEQMTALQNKMLKYVALQAEKGNFSGTYKIPTTATFSVPEKIGNATFVTQT